MLRQAKIDVNAKECLVLGTGGASVAIAYALEKLKATRIDFCSRTGDINYENVYTVQSDAEII